MRPWFAVAVLCGALSACELIERRHEQKLVILGFDGLDPDLTERWIASGALPNLAAVAAEGGLRRLETTPSADTPSVWASLATGLNPGAHGVFDLFTREGEPALVTPVPARRLLDRWLIRGPSFAATRGGTSFWVTAGEAAVRSSILGVPGTFPPEPVPRGEMLSGFPLPDARGTAGSSVYFATDLEDRGGAPPFPGVREKLHLQGRVARASLPGPRAPQARDVPIEITWNREARTVNVDIARETVHLAEGQWSRWVTVPFRLNPMVRWQGLVQFHLLRAGTELRLYASPIHWHPASPPVPISSPASLAGDLFERLGPFRTLGWPGAGWALANGDIDEAIFLDDLNRAFDDRAQVILSRLDARRWDLLVGVVDATDSVQHLLWRHIDPLHPAYDVALASRYGAAIHQMYRRADELVGQVRARMPAGAALVVLSAHGFHTLRALVDLNRWLAGRGYLAIRPDDRAAAALDPFTGPALPTGVDWSASTAYAVGFGQIVVNLQGRNPHGIVPPGAAYEALVARLRADLLEWRDPATLRRVVARVDTGREIYAGSRSAEAPDLQVGLAPGYRVSFSPMAGGRPRDAITPNATAWSGDHASMAGALTPGVFVATIKPARDRLHLIDIAPTVLKYFGVSIPASLEGRPIF